MRTRTKLLILIIGLAAGVAVVAQTGAIDALMEKVQGLLGEKAVDSTPFMNLAAPGDKAVDDELGPAFSEVEGEPGLPSASLLASIAEQLPDKDVPVEQGFLLSPKEPDPVGNQFLEDPTE